MIKDAFGICFWQEVSYIAESCRDIYCIDLYCEGVEEYIINIDMNMFW